MIQSGYRLRVTPGVARLRAGLHPRIKQRMRAALAAILADPSAGKPLRLELAGLRSFRTGRFRLITRIATDRILEIVAFGPRESIYEETARLLSREERGPKHGG